jgi:hypothetical protein
MPPPPVTTLVADFIKFAISHTSPNSAARSAVCAVQASHAYAAPETLDTLWIKLYTDFIVPHVAPYDTEEWTRPIHTRWDAVMTLRNRDADVGRDI